jgi:hypothetical protein
LKRQETSIAFYLITVFRGRTVDNDVTENYITKPLIITLTDSATGYNNGLVNMFTFNFVFNYSTLAQLPNYSKLDQFTITSKENNPSRSIPVATTRLATVISRAEEDKINNIARALRLSKTAPMRNLKDLFSGFESELKEMRYENRRQLQEFVSIVRPDTVKKIKQPKQKRVKSGSGLPLDFDVSIDKKYESYPVDNRNLMTEQTESKQTTAGITSITMSPGQNIFAAVDSLMKLSTRVGDDVSEGYAFKTAVSSYTDCEGIVKNSVGVKRYTIPVNKEGVKDTGPDKNGNINTLELDYINGESGLDILSLCFSSSPTTDIAILEEDSDDLGTANLVSSSEREQITFERAQSGGFSGLRINAPVMNFGLESAAKGTKIDMLKYRYALSQNTLTLATMVGNPDLYSDLARNPLKVAKMDADNAKLYRYPEFYPMYVSLTVKISNTYTYGETTNDDEDYWYHTYHYHLSGVTNSISGGKFVQTLRLLSTDDAI